MLSMTKAGDRLIRAANEARKIVDGGPSITSAGEAEQLAAAVALITEFMRREIIADECRDEACFGCASCNAVDLERRLNALLGFL